MTFTVRRARPSELPVIGEVTVAAYRADNYLLGDDDGYAVTLADAAARDAEAELWVAVDPGDMVLGTVTFAGPGSRWAEVARGAEGEFRMLAVAPEARGRGVGEALVRHCQQRARDEGLSGLVLSSLPQMRPAHRVYERLGFVRASERDWWPVPGEVRLIAYVWAADESVAATDVG